MQNNTWSNLNPFYAESQLPYNTIPFDIIKDTDYKPAFIEGMRQHLEEIQVIATNPSPATFENTFVAMEKAGRLLERVSNAFFALTSAHTNDFLNELEEEIAPQLSQHNDTIFLNEALFQRVQAVYHDRATLSLDKESQKLIEYYYNAFTIAGANLSPDKKEKLKLLNEEEVTLTTKFRTKLMEASNAAAPIVDDVELLKGVSANVLEVCAFNAANKGLSGKWLLPLQNTVQQPLLQSLQNRAVRKIVFDASLHRAQKGDKYDTSQILLSIAHIRAKKAQLMGFQDYASWKLQDQMAKTPEAVARFLKQLVVPAVSKVMDELQDIQLKINSQGNGFEATAWDWDFYAEQVRKEKYDLDEALMRPYFELNNVLEKGVFYAATQLYGIRFKERYDIPVYQEDVRVFEVFDKDATPMALFYFDPFKRDNKSGGAWMGNFVEQSFLLDKKPVIYNVCNYTKPMAGQSALISFDDVLTLFHEFGHALHGLFACQQFPGLSGTNVARDFVELPSQFNEHWALYPSVLKNYAIHYETKEPIPEALIAKIKKAARFNQGYRLTEYLAAAYIDLKWHTLQADTSLDDVATFEQDALFDVGLWISQVPPRYTSTIFQHIFGGGYAASYYAYSWSEVLDNDAFEWFEENGGLTLKNGQRFRDMILSIGNTQDYNEAYKAFRGKEPSIEPMLRHRGMNN